MHERSKNQRVIYCLATNLIGSLDSAAIREGRFDKKIGIYPPDLLSRAGRFIESLGGVDSITSLAKKDRAAQCIALAAGRGMARLGLPGWFSKCREGGKNEEGTPYRYVNNGKKVPQFPMPEEKCPDAPLKPLTSDSKKEWREWKWIVDWDSRPSRTWNELLNALADGKKVEFPKLPKKGKRIRSKALAIKGLRLARKGLKIL